MIAALRTATESARPFIGCLLNAHRNGEHFHSFLIVEPIELDVDASILVACHFDVAADNPVLRFKTHDQQTEAFATTQVDPRSHTASMAASAFRMRADANFALLRSQLDRV
jgi:hypothetical protein